MTSENIPTLYESVAGQLERLPTVLDVVAEREKNSQYFESDLNVKDQAIPTETRANSANYTYNLVNKGSFDTQMQCIMSVAWSPVGDLLGVAGDDGTIRVLTRHGQISYKMRPNSSGLPTTCLQWRPSSASLGSLQVLVSVDVTGQIVHWHVPSEKELYRLQEDDNQIYSVQYRKDGEQFATSGRDCTVRIYDESTKTNIISLNKAQTLCVGHSNRVFASVFDPNNPNVLVSGGWDNTLVMWDLREGGKPMNTIYGPHLAGQALDIQNDVILTGSWRPRDTLESWDIRTLKKIRAIGEEATPKVYTAQFEGTAAGVFIAGGASELTHENGLRLYNVEGREESKAVQLSNKKGIYTSSINRHGEIAFAGNCNRIEIFKLQN